MNSLRKIIRTVLRESLFGEEVIKETQTGQKDLEKFTNEVLKSLADAVLRNKSQMAALGESEDEPLYDLPATHTIMMNGAGYNEIGEFVKDTTIRIVPTRLIKGRRDLKGQLEYTAPDKFGNDFFKIWLKYNDADLDEINSMFKKHGADVTQQDIYFKMFYMFYSTLLHELQHAYDAWRSGGKAFNSQLNKNYISLQDKSNYIKSKNKNYDELTPEEIEAIGNGEKAYLNLVHEINARYAQAMQKTQLTGMDFNTFDDIKKNWEDVYRQFRTNFFGWNLLSDKMKRKLTRRVAKAYQEESENLKTAKEKYSKKDLEMVSENIQLADKTYFTPGRLSPRVREIIVSKITNGDAWTKLICDIYFAMAQNNHAVGDWAVRSLDDSSAEIDRSEKKLENDVMGIDDWKKVKSYYQQLKAYNKNVFPIIGLNPNGVEDIWSLIRALDQRATILEKIKLLPSIALRNMREDIRVPRGGSEMNNYRHNLENFLAYYSLLDNREAELKRFVEKKMFKSGMTIDKLLNFVEEKENLLGGKKFDKDVIKDLIEDNNHGELEIIYEQGDIMIVEVSGPYGIKDIGCNSLWCFTYGEGYSRNWSQYSYNDTVYIIIDFSESSDSANFMNVVIKPLVWNPKSEDEEEINDETIFDMSNTNRYDALRFLGSTIGLDTAKKLLTFYVEPEEEEYEEEEDSLMELRKIVRQTIIEQQQKRLAAGVLIKCLSTDRVFLLLRNDPTPTWALVSGKIEDGENVLSGLKREIYEELFVNASIIDFKFIRKENIPEKNMEFHYYEGFVDKEFTPILDEENLNGKWFSIDNLPSPLYDGMSSKIEKIFNEGY